MTGGFTSRCSPGSMDVQIETRVAGIPCLVEVDYYDPGDTCKRNGHPDNWYEDVPAYLEYSILDRGGRPAPWLERKASEDDHARIFREVTARLSKH